MKYIFAPLLLRTFVTVVDEASFSRAATRLHLTQSAISGHIRRLEEQIGKPLLERTTRSLSVTTDGKTLLPYARAILALNRDAWAELTGSPLRGRIRIGLSEDFAELRLLHSLQDFIAQYPGLEIHIQVNIPGTLLQLMKQGDLDMVIGSQCDVDETGILLWKERLIWAYPNQPVIKLPTPLPLALFPEPCPYREAALVRLAQSGMAQRTAMLCTSIATLRVAALSGFAVAPMVASQLVQGLAALDAEHGLPELPDAEFRLFASTQADQDIIAALSRLILEYCATRRN